MSIRGRFSEDGWTVRDWRWMGVVGIQGPRLEEGSKVQKRFKTLRSGGTSQHSIHGARPKQERDN